MEAKIQITELKNSGDGRGFSFTAPSEALAFVGRMSWRQMVLALG